MRFSSSARESVGRTIPNAKNQQREEEEEEATATAGANKRRRKKTYTHRARGKTHSSVGARLERTTTKYNESHIRATSTQENYRIKKKSTKQ